MKKLYALLASATVSIFAFSQSQGPNNPANAMNVPAPVGTPWTNPMNVFMSDGMNAQAAPLNVYPSCGGTNCFYTNPLVATNFGFTIPVGSVINGIVAEVQKFAINGPGAAFDSTVKIVKNGLPTGPNKASAVAWASLAYTTYGSPTDLWGTTWTVADINNMNFGLSVSARNTSPVMMPGVFIDHIRFTVYFTPPLGINLPATSAELFTINPSVDGQLQVNYNLGTSANATLSVVNTLGEIILSKPITGTEGTALIDGSAFATGMYVVKISCGEQQQVKKIMTGK